MKKTRTLFGNWVFGVSIRLADYSSCQETPRLAGVRELSGIQPFALRKNILHILFSITPLCPPVFFVAKQS